METDDKPQSPREQLRDRLIEMREELIDRLVAQIIGGDLALLANVATAIAALDQVEEQPKREAA